MEMAGRADVIAKSGEVFVGLMDELKRDCQE
jgi:hypothetical protein